MNNSQFESIYKILELIALNTIHGGDSFRFEPRYYNRKGQDIFSVTIKYNKFNRKVEDYFSVFINDETKASDFDEMRKEMVDFISELSEVKMPKEFHNDFSNHE